MYEMHSTHAASFGHIWASFGHIWASYGHICHIVENPNPHDPMSRHEDVSIYGNHALTDHVLFVYISSVSARISKGQGAVSAKKGNLCRSTEKH
jgi:hypothetical protein